MELILGHGTVDKGLPNGLHCIENPKARLLYWFGQSHVIVNGRLQVIFDAEQKIAQLSFASTDYDESVSRKMVIEAATPNHHWIKEWQKLNDPKQSPEMSKKGKAKQLKSPPTAPPDIDLPASAVKSNMGITEPVFQYLEMAEVMVTLEPLMAFSLSNPGLGAYQALSEYVAQNIANGGVQPVMNGQQPGIIPGGQRTPSFGQFPGMHGASPAAVHLQLPGSPHMGSPAPSHMQAPGMALQQSQQGTSSSGPSANTSPASHKRRRPSGVKAEDDSGAPTPASMGAAPQVNGVGMGNKAKPQTPRMQNQKRVKGNPS